MINQKELAKTLQILRAKNGLTQIELANKSGVSTCTVAFIENCKKVPRVDTLIKIAKALSVDEDELLKYIM